MPKLSVIIPTCNRRDTLLKTLERFSRQEGIRTDEYELVVVDDASSDGTPEAIREWAARAGMRLLWAVQPDNRGPACARNRAIVLATAPVLLITGDDILPAPDLLRRHIQWHAAHPAEEDALLGRVTWPDNPPPTPFMRWLDRGECAYFFHYPDKPGPVPADRFYTCNVSVKRVLIERLGGFDESFPRASHEDLELGLRLSRQGGMRLYYDPEAIGFHDHRLSFSSTFRRMYFVGYSSILFWSKVGESGSTAKRACRRLIRAAASLGMLRKAVVPLVGRAETLSSSPLWKALLHAAYWFGVADAARGRPAAPPGAETAGSDQPAPSAGGRGREEE